MTIQIQIRRDTAVNWAAQTPDPVLAEGELGLDTTADKFKIGDGTTVWSALAFQEGSITTVVNNLTSDSASNALSAGQGKALKALIDGQASDIATGTGHASSAHAPTDAEANIQPDWTQATSTADDFIKNKPTVPASFAPTDAEANIQPDWTQATSTADDFIKNKPTVPASFAPTDAEANIQPDWTQATSTADDFIKNKPTGIFSNWSEDASGNLVPDGDGTRDIGTTSLKVKDLHLSGSTLHLGSQSISADAEGVGMPALILGSGNNTVKLSASATGGLVQTSTVGGVAQPPSTGGSSVASSDTPPAGPTAGDLWIDSSTMQLNTYYEDEDSSQWVGTSAIVSGGTGGTGGTTNLTAGVIWDNHSTTAYDYTNDGVAGSSGTTATDITVVADKTAVLTHTSDTEELRSVYIEKYVDAIAESDKTVTANGNVNHSTALGGGKFGASSIYFDGADNFLSSSEAGDYLEIAPTTDFQFGGDDFTVEFWLKLSDTSIQWNTLVFFGDPESFLIGYHSAFGVGVKWNGVAANTDAPITNNDWHHLAVVRSGTDALVFLDGVQILLTAMGNVVLNSFTTVKFGKNAYGWLYDYKGYMDEIRISNTARYTANFTPSTTTFSPDASTVLLIHSDDTNGSTIFTDTVTPAPPYWQLETYNDWGVQFTDSTTTTITNNTGADATARFRITAPTASAGGTGGGATSSTEHFDVSLAAGASQSLTLATAHDNKSIAHAKKFIPGASVTNVDWDFDTTDEAQWNFLSNKIEFVDGKVQLKGTTTGADILAISCGEYFAMAVMADGTVRAVGRNESGELGIGTTVNQSSWVTSNITGVTSIVCGQKHAMALMPDGTVKAVGENGFGQLGIGNETTPQSSWVTSNITGVVDIACGRYHSAVVQSGTGTVQTVGYNAQGQLAIGGGGNKSSWQQTLSGAASVECGVYQTYPLMPNGTVWAAGWNTFGQLGDGTQSQASMFVLSNITGVASLFAGEFFVYAIQSNGTVKAVGYNSNGQLGNGNTTHSSSWVTSGITGVASIACDGYHPMALMPDGTVKVVSVNGNGQLGIGTAVDQPSWVSSNITGVASLATKGAMSYALMSDGTVQSVGANEKGQLGDGTVNERHSWGTSNITSIITSFDGTNGAIDSTVPISLTNTGTINSIAVMESKPTGTDVKYALSFDGKTTWNVPSGVITDIATQGVSATTLATYDFTGFTGNTLDVGIYLSTTDSSVSPTVDQITVGMSLNGQYTQVVVDGDKLQALESGTHVVAITNGDSVANIYKISVGAL